MMTVAKGSILALRLIWMLGRIIWASVATPMLPMMLIPLILVMIHRGKMVPLVLQPSASSFKTRQETKILMVSAEVQHP